VKRTLALSLVILLISTGLGLAEPAETPKPPSWPDPDRLNYEEIKFSPPKPERVVLENGLTVYFLEDRELPLVNISFVVGAGSVFEPSGKEGLAEMTGDVMRTGGAGKLGGDKIDEELESLAARVSISLGMEYGTGSLSVLKKDLNRAFTIFADIIRHPSFDEAKLEQEKNLKIEELRRVFDKPQRLAFREYRRAIYAGNPRGRLPEIASIEKMEREDLAAFHKAHFFPRNLRVAVTGDLSKQEAIELISRHFDDWDDEGDFGTAPLPKPQENAPLYYYEKKVPQSTVIIGTIGPGKESPDFYPFTVLDYILGSGVPFPDLSGDPEQPGARLQRGEFLRRPSGIWFLRGLCHDEIGVHGPGPLPDGRDPEGGAGLEISGAGPPPGKTLHREQLYLFLHVAPHDRLPAHDPRVPGAPDEIPRGIPCQDRCGEPGGCHEGGGEISRPGQKDDLCARGPE